MPFPFKSSTPHSHAPSSSNNNNTSNNRPRRANPVSAIPIPRDEFVPEPYAPPFVSPWPSARPQSPTTQLRRSFRSFVSSENFARQQRNEVPFATPEARDRAFDKLMRLSRGEEEIGWAIAPVGIGEEWEEETEIVWVAGKWVRRKVMVEKKEQMVKMEVVEEKKDEEVEESKDGVKQDDAMKDVHQSKEVAQNTDMKIEDDADWEDISHWQIQLQALASGPKHKTTSTTNNKGKEKADHERKDSKECAVLMDRADENVIKVERGRGASVTYTENVSKVTTNENEAGSSLQHW